jgi:ribosomal-protein-alanine N-acetyltransferase
MILNFDPFPVLETNRVLLRRIEETDAEEIFQIRSDERIMQFIDRPRAKSIEDARALISRITDDTNKSQGITWAITLKENIKLLGTIGFWRITVEHFRAEIGYMLNFDYQGKGILSEAMPAILQYGFETIGLHSVEAQVKPGNNASIKLLEKNGFVREAYFNENYFFDGKFLDTVVYSVLKNGYHPEKV